MQLTWSWLPIRDSSPMPCPRFAPFSKWISECHHNNGFLNHIGEVPVLTLFEADCPALLNEPMSTLQRLVLVPQQPSTG